MSDILPFVLARYNYWIVIVLMMTGLYIVFSRGNLVKTVVGLNIFQTSVFIFYITLGKVAGGTAPILVGGHGQEDAHGEGHGDGHGDEHDAPHGADHGAALTPEEAAAYASSERANDVGALARADLPTTPNLDGLHDAAIDANALTPGGGAPAVAAPSVDVAVADAHGGVEIVPAEASGAAHGAGHAGDAGLDILYSNPLPHVLILTAIVVGVATTAVGLAIAVRIREAYGTVEEDALERMDNEAAGYVAADEAGATPG